MEGDRRSPGRAMGRHISIHTLRMEGDEQRLRIGDRWTEISIHTLRMEGDVRRPPGAPDLQISIHTLRMEGDSAGFAKRSIP